MYALSQIPETLYHYTSLQGLLGILESGQLWASHIRYLNDQSEQKHIWSMIESRTAGKHLAENHPDVRNALENLQLYVRNRRIKDTYVTSFSSDGDLLSQWLSYCPLGVGFSIGFKRNVLLGIPKNGDWTKGRMGTGVYLTPVLYMREGDHALLDQIIDLFTGRNLELQTNSDDPIVKMLLSPEALSLGALNALEARVKDGSFAAEKECRLVLEGDVGDVRFRAGKSMMIPYRTFPFASEDDKGIGRIIIGPCPSPKLSSESLQKLLNTRGYSGVEISQSSIPYRSW